jgi:hypothetical protein
MRRHAAVFLLGLGLVAALVSGCAADPPPDETTPDGLVRVPARSVGGVYRAPNATYFQYHRVILEAPSVSFIEDWTKNHPDVGPTEIARLRAECVRLFREEFTRQFVRYGSYQFADEPAADVLLIVPVIEEFNVIAPQAGDTPGQSTLLPGRPVTMKITGDIRDALTGKILGRVITYHPPEQNPTHELRLADRTATGQEERRVFAEWSLLAREAIDVAKAAMPRPPKKDQSGASTR